MTYFSFREIFIGGLAFILVGLVALLCTLSLRLIYECKQSLLSMACRLYKEREHPLHSKKDIFMCTARRSGGFFTDFFTVLVLFLGYILVSYIFFDGVCRFVFLILSWFSYIVFRNFLGQTLFKYVVLVFKSVFWMIESVLSVVVFVIYKCFYIIKNPILLIIKYVRRAIIKTIEPSKKHRYLKNTEENFEHAMEAFCSSS